MLESIFFSFDGVNSKDMNVHIVRTDNGLYNDIFLPERKIIEKQIANREKPYLQKVEQSPLSFSFSIYVQDWKEQKSLRKVARWLFQDYYKPLVFESNPNRIFYVIFDGQASLKHNGAKDGYIELNVRCDSPYGYTPEYTINNIQFRDSNATQTISNNTNTFDNGTHSNTIVTTNGLTIDNPNLTWETFYSLYKTWGDI